MAAITRLPTELWQQIFSCIAQDRTSSSFVDLWVSGRQVCHAWRAQIAKAYLDTFIRNPSRCYVTFDCGRHYIEEIGKCFMGVEMVFDRLDPNDRGRCIFKEGKETGGKLPRWYGKEARTQYSASKYGTWVDHLETYMCKDLHEGPLEWDQLSDDEDSSEGNNETGQGQGEVPAPISHHDVRDEWIDSEVENGLNFEYPAHVLVLYGTANDTELPGLRVNVKRVEISFEWESMLTTYITERKEINRRNNLEVERIGTSLREQQVDPLMMTDDFETLFAGLNELNDSAANNLRDVRRSRIRNAIKERGEEEFRDGTYNFTDDDFDFDFEGKQLQRILMYDGGFDDGEEEDGNEREEEDDDDENDSEDEDDNDDTDIDYESDDE